ncbi:MAG: sigma-70 family RNA polymerase sigma factor [Pseudomonadota bacterium]
MSRNLPINAEDLLLDIDQLFWLGSDDQIDESVQTVAEKLLRSGMKPGRAYAMTMLRNANIDKIRAENTRRSYEANFADEAVSVDERSAEFHVANREAITALQKAVGELSALKQEIFVRAFIQGQTRSAIASDLGLSLSNIEKKLSSVRRHCMDRLGPYYSSS